MTRIHKPPDECALVLLCFLFLSTLLRAQTVIHVPADQPTIQAGIDAASNGDTVLVAPGTYNESIDFKGKSITVTTGAASYSDAPVATTAIESSASGPVVTMQSGETINSVLNGFTITHAADSSGSVPIGDGVAIANNSSATISNNVITSNTGCGVSAINSPQLSIQGNHLTEQHYSSIGYCGSNLFPNSGVYYAGDAGTGTIAITGSGTVIVASNLIEGNTFQVVSGIGVLAVSDLTLLNNIVRNNIGSNASIGARYVLNTKLIQNLVYDNVATDAVGEPDQSSGSAGIGLDYLRNPFDSSTWISATLTIVNNTVYGNRNVTGFIGPGSQLWLEGPFTAATVANNIFGGIDTATNIECIDMGTSPVMWSHNDTFGLNPSPSNGCTIAAQSYGSDTGNLSVDPQFLNPSSDDFHTQPSSLVVAAGDINAPLIPSADLDGKARTVCGTIDMGVYEIRPSPPITLQASANPATGGSPVTFTATLKGNCNLPTGSVTFLDGATVLGTVVLNGSASASLTTSALSVGTHAITVTYPGDFNFESSTSSVLNEVITGYPTSTTLNTVSPNPADAFQTVTLTATVSSAFGTPSGTVTFDADGKPIATATLNSAGGAIAAVNTLGAGKYSITAVYGATTDFAASTSSAVQETVVGANTATALATAPNPVIYGQTLTLTATVSATQGSGVPAGTVTFSDGAQSIGSATLSTNGVATLNTSSLALGTHSVTASYDGSSNANPSASAPVSVTVAPIPTSLGLTATPNPANYGQTVTFTATVGASGALSGGTVTFFDQGNPLGTVPLNGSDAASFSTSSLLAGTHQIAATFTPSGPDAPSSSAPLSETILSYDFALSPSSTSLTMPDNSFETLSVTVTPIGGFPGTVVLACSSLPTYLICRFHPSTTQPLSSGAQTVQVTLNTSDVFGYGHRVGDLVFPGGTRSGAQLAGVVLPTIVLFGLAGSRKHRCTSGLRRVLLLVVLAAVGLGMTACSGRLPDAPTPGTYAITLTGTDTNPNSHISHAVNLQLRVAQN